MAAYCEVIVDDGATPEQRSTLGAALWRWCVRTAGDAGIYRYLDDQPLADLIAGRAPASSRVPGRHERRGVHLRVRDDVSPDRQATIDGLRREMPAEGVVDIIVDGVSWNPVESRGSTRAARNE
jgi:hypothetical protein